MVNDILIFIKDLTIPILKPKSIPKELIAQYTSNTSQLILPDYALAFYSNLQIDNFFWIEKVPENILPFDNSLFHHENKENNSPLLIENQRKMNQIKVSIREQEGQYFQVNELIVYFDKRTKQLHLGKIIEIKEKTLTINLASETKNCPLSDCQYAFSDEELYSIPKDWVIISGVKLTLKDQIYKQTVTKIEKKLKLLGLK